MNFNRPKVTRRRRRKGATTHLYDFITLFLFCKVRLRSFFALFLRFLPPFPPPGNDVGGRTQNRDGRCRGEDKRLLFSVSGGRSGRPYSPENARFPFPLCKRDRASTTRLPRQTTCKRGRRRGVSLGIRFQVDSLLPLHKIPCRFPACFGAAPAVAFSENFIFPKDPLLRFRGYSAARTMRSGYTLLVRSVDPSGQIMSRTYPSSPNVTGISTVRVS